MQVMTIKAQVFFFLVETEVDPFGSKSILNLFPLKQIMVTVLFDGNIIARSTLWIENIVTATHFV